MSAPNPFLLAADDSASLLPLLRQEPAIATRQDEHGYSLLHAAASYDRIPLLRALVHDFNVDVNLTDEDGETCLFVTENVAVATCLVEELRLDTGVVNKDGLTATEKIEEEGEYPEVATYLRVNATVRERARPGGVTTLTGDRPPIAEGPSPPPSTTQPPSLPANVRMNISTAEDGGHGEGGNGEPDPEFRRRIEELAAKEDFRGEDSQRELRTLITDAVRGVAAEERDTRRRIH
jgi:uncharacterized protein